MSIVEAALNSFRRWRSTNPDASLPDVRVTAYSGEFWNLTGLVVHPREEADSIALASVGHELPVIVLREDDIATIEIGMKQAPPFGYAAAAGRGTGESS